MIQLTEEQIPLLQGQLIINDCCFALGVVEQGVIIQYLEIPNGNAILVEWSDIIALGEKDIMGSHKPPVAIQKPGSMQKGKRI